MAQSIHPITADFHIHHEDVEKKFEEVLISNIFFKYNLTKIILDKLLPRVVYTQRTKGPVSIEKTQKKNAKISSNLVILYYNTFTYQ